MRIIVCGPRDWDDRDRVWQVLFAETMPTDVIIVGGAWGVDAIARDWALYTGRRVLIFNADWDKHGKAAGPIRNGEMITDGGGERLIAFQRLNYSTPGTSNMIKQALTARLPVSVFAETGAAITPAPRFTF